MSTHNCPYCNQVVQDGDPYCAKCGGPQTYKTGGVAGIGAVSLKLDPWIITAPQAKERFQTDDEAVKAMVNTWRHDPDHPHTVQIQQEIEAAVGRGSLARTDSYYFCCPWSPIFNVNRDVTVGGKSLKRGEQFTFDISAEEIPEGGKFRREILVGDFSTTNKVDYCLPDDKPDNNR